MHQDLSNKSVWYVIYTKPRHEKKVADQLQDHGISVFCPLITTVKQWSDRKKKVKEPLFKSLVFVQVEEKLRDSVFNIPGVVRYLYWLGKPAIVKEYEILAIKDLIDRFDGLASFQVHAFKPNHLVKVIAGGLKGYEGEVVQVKKHTVVLKIDGLQMSLQVNMNPGDLQLLETN
jgi:transcription antitermination factor NusG